MKKLTLIGFIGLIALIEPIGRVCAAPARPIVETLTLQDGTAVEAVFMGDEQCHYWQARDGKCYMKAENGMFVEQTSLPVSVDRLAVNELQEPMRAPGMMRTPNVKNLAPRGLVILANFQEKQFRPENTPAAIDSMLNGDTTRYHKSIGSAKQYFSAMSHGQYVPQFDVVGPVMLPDSSQYYGRNVGGRGNDAMPADMVYKACSIASQIPGVDLTRYDNDNDGKLDIVFVIFAGYGESDSHIDSLIWPASWTMASAVASGKTSLPSNSPASAYTFQGKQIHYYAYTGELNYFNTIYRPTPGYDADHPLRAGIGLFCHEFSHVLGLPDYYVTFNTKASVNYNQFLTPGNWDVMDVGLYDGDGYIPAAYSAHERWWMGWDTPTLLNDSADVTLVADHQSACYVTRSGSTAVATTPDTVYYLENRQQTGWDTGLPGHGLLVLRVVFNNAIWSANSVNNTDYQPRYIHIPADGTYTYNNRTGIQGDDGDPFPGTVNITSFTPFPDYPLTDIREENGEILFKFMGGGTGTSLWPEAKAEETPSVYSLTGLYMGDNMNNLPAGVYILRSGTGKTEKVLLR